MKTIFAGGLWKVAQVAARTILTGSMLASGVSVLLHAQESFWDSPDAYLGQTPPSDTPKEFAPGQLADKGSFVLGRVAFLRDGKEFYFTRNDSWKAGDHSKLRVVRYADHRWNKPEVLAEQFMSPTFSMDGNTLYMRKGGMLVKPGKTRTPAGPARAGPACDEAPKPETYPKECYSYSAMPNKEGGWLNGSRATSMDLIGKFVGSLAGASGETGRRVVDQTGLTGLWDFTLESPPPTQSSPGDVASSGLTMIEAVSDQLGIKLKAARAVVSVLVVDHVERPSGN